MRAIQIKRIKEFMNTLLLGDRFDAFLVSKVQLTTFTDVYIDGHLHPEYFEETDGKTNEATNGKTEGETRKEMHNGYVRWAQLRPYCLSLIKGGRTPLRLQIVFLQNETETARLILETGIDPEDIEALVLNCNFQNDSLMLTGGISYNRFIPDKSLEQRWDNYIDAEFSEEVSE